MNPLLQKGHVTKAFAAALVAGAYLLARPATFDDASRSALAARYRFAELPLALPEGGPPERARRPVDASLEPIAGWISSVGAGVALADLDGDGAPNDVCLVDPRTDRVVIAAMPGGEPRYAAFALDLSAVAYDEATMAPMGCTPNDMNEDGVDDLLVYYWGRPPVAYLARGDAPMGAKRYVAQELLPASERWYTNAATFADFDGDGHVDVAIGNYFPDGAHILGGGTAGESMQDSMSRAMNGGRNRIGLWRAARGGDAPSVEYAFVEPWGDAQSTGWTLALGAADLDGDLLPELYVANDFGSDVMLHNRSKPGEPRFEPVYGRRHFTTPRSKVVGRDSFKGMGVDFGDIDGDGALDLFVSNIAQEWALQESHFVYVNTKRNADWQQGIAPFDDRSESLGMSRSGWGWDTRFGDFDNDGALEALQATGFLKGAVNRWPELHEIAMGNDFNLRFPGMWHRFSAGDDLSGHQHNPFYARGKDGRFHDLAEAVGLSRTGVTRGIATADTDGDGRLDIAVARQWEASHAYLNRSEKAGRFLGLRLMLPRDPAATSVREGRPPQPGARAAIGAQAVVHLADGRVLVSQVDGGNGHSGKRSPELHFGLGDTAGPVRVELRWRDAHGRTQAETLNLDAGWHTVLLGSPGTATAVAAVN